MRLNDMGGTTLAEKSKTHQQPSNEVLEDIVDLLKKHGYGVVEGADSVRAKIKEIGNGIQQLRP